MISLKDLHDATLVGLGMEWSAGSLVLDLEACMTGTPSVKVVAGGLTMLKCPRQHPWDRVTRSIMRALSRRTREYY